MNATICYTHSTEESKNTWVAYKKHKPNAKSAPDFVAGFNAAKAIFENSKKKN